MLYKLCNVEKTTKPLSGVTFVRNRSWATSRVGGSGDVYKNLQVVGSKDPLEVGLARHLAITFGGRKSGPSCLELLVGLAVVSWFLLKPLVEEVTGKKEPGSTVKGWQGFLEPRSPEQDANIELEMTEAAAGIKQGLKGLLIDFFKAPETQAFLKEITTATAENPIVTVEETNVITDLQEEEPLIDHLEGDEPIYGNNEASETSPGNPNFTSSRNAREFQVGRSRLLWSRSNLFLKYRPPAMDQPNFFENQFEQAWRFGLRDPGWDNVLFSIENGFKTKSGNGLRAAKTFGQLTLPTFYTMVQNATDEELKILLAPSKINNNTIEDLRQYRDTFFKKPYKKNKNLIQVLQVFKDLETLTFEEQRRMVNLYTATRLKEFGWTSINNLPERLNLHWLPSAAKDLRKKWNSNAGLETTDRLWKILNHEIANENSSETSLYYWANPGIDGAVVKGKSRTIGLTGKITALNQLLFYMSGCYSPIDIGNTSNLDARLAPLPAFCYTLANERYRQKYGENIPLYSAFRNSRRQKEANDNSTRSIHMEGYAVDLDDETGVKNNNGTLINEKFEFATECLNMFGFIRRYAKGKNSFIYRNKENLAALENGHFEFVGIFDLSVLPKSVQKKYLAVAHASIPIYVEADWPYAKLYYLIPGPTGKMIIHTAPALVGLDGPFSQIPANLYNLR